MLLRVLVVDVKELVLGASVRTGTPVTVTLPALGKGGRLPPSTVAAAGADAADLASRLTKGACLAPDELLSGYR